MTAGDGQAARLFAAGHTYREIADLLGLPSAGAARRAIQEDLMDAATAGTAELKALELERLRFLIAGAEEQMRLSGWDGVPHSPVADMSWDELRKHLARLRAELGMPEE